MAKKTRKIGEDAITGRFISIKDANARPKSTIVRTIKKGK